MSGGGRRPARYLLRRAADREDLRRLQALRGLCFSGRRGVTEGDALDVRCLHGMVIRRATGALVGGFRLQVFPGGDALAGSYSAGFYDLAGLAALPGVKAELGRVCVAPGRNDPEILRLIWAGVARIVTLREVRTLFGCPSFPGTDPAAHAAAFAWLAAHRAAPADWRPVPPAGRPDRVMLAGAPVPAEMAALRGMPPALRFYLGLGGRVSDHAVIDRDMGTCHVLAALQLDDIPPGRLRLLARLGAGLHGFP